MDANAAEQVRISATGLTKRYPRGRRGEPETALRDFDLRLAPGELLVLAGPNGAGKSTALRLIAGLEIPDEGRVTIDGAPPRSLSARRTTAWLPDATELFPFLDWRETLVYFGEIAGVSGPELRERTERLGETWGLVHFGKKRARGFSLGMRRRLAIASVLIGAPRVLLLDEPVSGLDPEGQALFLEELVAEKQRGTSVIMSSHHFSRLDDYADRLRVLRAGTTVLDGTLEEIAAGCLGRDLTISGLDDAGWAELEEVVARRGGRVAPRRLPQEELERIVLDEAPDADADGP